MEYFLLIFLHVFLGIVWAGGGIVTGLFVIPSVLDAGPAAGPVMAGVAKRRLPLVLTLAAALVVLTGIRLYMIRFTPAWLTTPEGLVLTLGGLLGLAAFAMGVFVQRPTVQRIGQLSAAIAQAGGPPTASQQAELQALRARLRRIAPVVAWHLLAAAALMSAHRFAVVL